MREVLGGEFRRDADADAGAGADDGDELGLCHGGL